MKRLLEKLMLFVLCSIFCYNAISQNIALNKTVKVSSVRSSSYSGSYAVDGNASTKWSSASSDPQWVYVDLGGQYNITQVKITWGSSYGKNYTINTSNDASTWTTIKTITSNTSLSNTNSVTGTGRYVRIYGTARGTSSSYYSITELTIAGTAVTTATTGTGGTTAGGVTNTYGGKTYYFSTTDGDDSRTSTQAQSSSTPWKTLTKLNSVFSTLVAGDLVVFKRGDVFYGSITPSVSGTSSKPITFSAYGTGAKPVITGFSTVSSWTAASNGVYESVLSAGLTSLNMVTVNGAFQPIGRYPKRTATNGGYLTIGTASGNTSFTSTQLSGIPSFTGGQVVIRKVNWIIDKGTVTSQSSSSVAYSGGGYNATNGYGFFFQNHINACTAVGDWCYDPSTKKIKMYFGSAGANGKTVNAATVDVLVTINSRSYITFDNIAFSGSNSKTFSINTGNNIVINACDFTFSGIDGLNITPSSSYIKLTNSTSLWTNNNFVSGGASTYLNIVGNTISTTATTPGMGNSGDGTHIAIYNLGTGSLAQYNTIKNTGYIGIHFSGSSVSVLNNVVDSFCTIKDDGGGIYTFTGSTATVYSQRIVSNNIVLNGGGTGSSDAFGIYMDNNSSNVTISGNTVANCGSSGIFVHSAHDIKVTGNTVYNNSLTGPYGQVLVNQVGSLLTRNIQLTGNKVVSKTSTQLVAYYGSDKADVNLFGTFDTNYYCRPMAENATTFAVIKSSVRQNTNLAGWKTIIAKENNSKTSPMTITNAALLRFEYNATTASKTISLGGTYMDMTGKTYTSVTLAPYTSTVLISTGSSARMMTADSIQTLLPDVPSLTVFPNPVGSSFAIRLNNEHMGKMNVQIINTAGAIVKSYISSKDQKLNQVNINANDLPRGAYFIHVQIGDWSERRAIIKQ